MFNKTQDYTMEQRRSRWLESEGQVQSIVYSILNVLAPNRERPTGKHDPYFLPPKLPRPFDFILNQALIYECFGRDFWWAKFKKYLKF